MRTEQVGAWAGQKEVKMRSLMLSIAAVAMAAGCMQYDYAYMRKPAAPAPEQDPGADSEIPEGKMLVQDVRTGNLMLIDDPSYVAPAQRPEPRIRTLPLPPIPTPRGVIRPRIALPPLPQPQGPAAATLVQDPRRPDRPRIDISLSAFMFEASGSVYGHADYASSADMEDDLGIEDGAGVSLDLALVLPKGAKFRLGVTALSTTGEEMPPLPGDVLPYTASVDLTIVDLAFTPMAYFGRWGHLSLETGLRYGVASVAIVGSQRHAEGLMISVGGELGINLYKDVLEARTIGSLGIGIDSFCLQFETGLVLKVSPNFRMGLGYRFLGMSLMDSAGDYDERAVGIGAAGPCLELGLTF